MADEKPIGSIPFTDGTVRPAFLDAGGRQYILDDEGQPVYGTACGCTSTSQKSLIVRIASRSDAHLKGAVAKVASRLTEPSL
jgi:hypothetical protein